MHVSSPRRLPCLDLLQVLKPSCKTKHRLAVPNVVHEPSRRPHACSEYTSEPPTAIDFDLVLFLDLPRWAAGRGCWKSGAAHTLDIYKSTNHWNPRNALFHFPCQADHTAVIKASKPCCTASPFPFFFDIWLLHSLFSLSIPFSLLFSSSCSLRLGFFHLHLSILSPSHWAAALEAKPAPLLLTCLSKLHTGFFAQSISDWALVVRIWKY